MCVYVCFCVCLCLCLCVSVCVCVHIGASGAAADSTSEGVDQLFPLSFPSIQARTCMLGVDVCAHVHACMCAHVYVCMCVHVCACVGMHMCVVFLCVCVLYTPAPARTDTFTYVHT